MKTGITVVTIASLAGNTQAHDGHGLDSLLAHAAGHGVELALGTLAIAVLALIWSRRPRSQ